ncbi:MAG TPA: DNA recombination protein RmuC [Planctomycetota bacterium]|jgi:DNA recombination protein RmuC|nr:DNA recombination protein RmuC [Planctomycetota bacterium]
MIEALYAVVAFTVGFAVAWLIRRTRELPDRVRLETQLAEARKSLEDQKKLLEDAQAKLEVAFKALAADALKSSNESFLRLAQETLQKHVSQASGDLELRKKAVEDLIKPISDQLKVYQEKADLMEKERQTAYGGLTNLLTTVSQTQEKLKQETGALVSALRRPNVRGQWGEFTLRRVVELAGMTEHCDFNTQETVMSEDQLQRPDLVVRLPSKRDIVVDSKAVAEGYFEAMEAQTDEARKAALVKHASHLRDRMKGLSSKKYWESLKSVDFVVLFVPAEPILDAAVQVDPGLIEDAMLNKVVIATPATLVALLKAVAYGWRQEKLAENAVKVADEGKKLLDSVNVWAGHFLKLRGAVFDVVQHFNAAQGSMERNVLPKAHRMKELGVATLKDIPAIEPVSEVPRAVEAPKAE